MANLKSSKKDLRRIAKRTTKNTDVRTALKTYVKKARVATASGDATAAVAAVNVAAQKLDKAAQNGVIHRNTAARRKSRIAKQAAKLAK